ELYLGTRLMQFIRSLLSLFSCIARPVFFFFFFFSSRRRHTRWPRDWSSDVCSSDLAGDVRLRATVDRRPLAAVWLETVGLPADRPRSDRARRRCRLGETSGRDDILERPGVDEEVEAWADRC